jgi:hypothetical protein
MVGAASTYKTSVNIYQTTRPTFQKMATFKLAGVRTWNFTWSYVAKDGVQKREYIQYLLLEGAVFWGVCYVGLYFPGQISYQIRRKMSDGLDAEETDIILWSRKDLPGKILVHFNCLKLKFI